MWVWEGLADPEKGAQKTERAAIPGRVSDCNALTGQCAQQCQRVTRARLHDPDPLHSPSQPSPCPPPLPDCPAGLKALVSAAKGSVFCQGRLLLWVSGAPHAALLAPKAGREPPAGGAGQRQSVLRTEGSGHFYRRPRPLSRHRAFLFN